MKSIISRDNPTYKQLKKLSESPRERRKAGQALLDGVHLIEAALAAGISLHWLIVAEGAEDDLEISGLIGRTSPARTLVLSKALFAELSPVDTPTGISAVIEIPRPVIPARPDFCLMIEDVQDPGNLGSILRSAAAAGVQLAWLSAGCADAWSPRVLRGGMGAHFVLPIVERVDLLATATTYTGRTLAACLGGDSLYQLDLTGPVAFMIGNEGAGLSDALISAASQRFTIPMPGRVESLNVAAAAAVCMFERLRQTLPVRAD